MLPSLETNTKVNFIRWNERHRIMDTSQCLSGIFLTVLLRWEAAPWRPISLAQTGSSCIVVICGVKLHLPLVPIYDCVPLQHGIISKPVPVPHGLNFMAQGTGCLQIPASRQQWHSCADQTGATQKEEVTPLNPQKIWDVTVLLTWLLAPFKLKLLNCICNVPVITVPAQSARKPSSGFLK